MRGPGWWWSPPGARRCRPLRCWRRSWWLDGRWWRLASRRARRAGSGWRGLGGGAVAGASGVCDVHVGVDGGAEGCGGHACGVWRVWWRVQARYRAGRGRGGGCCSSRRSVLMRRCGSCSVALVSGAALVVVRPAGPRLGAECWRGWCAAGGGDAPDVAAGDAGGAGCGGRRGARGCGWWSGGEALAAGWRRGGRRAARCWSMRTGRRRRRCDATACGAVSRARRGSPDRRADR